MHDFDAPSAPRPLLLPSGLAPELQAGMRELLDNVRVRLAALEADREVKAARAKLNQEGKEQQKSAMTELEGIARSLGFGLRSVGGGVQTFPILHGKPVSAEQFEVLDESTKKSLTEAEDKLSAAIDEAAERVRKRSREIEEQNRALEERIVRDAVEGEAGPLLDRFGEIAEVRDWLLRTIAELVASVDDLTAPPPKKSKDEDEWQDPEIATRLLRFVVNVFVTHEPGEAGQENELVAESARASRSSFVGPAVPVVFEDNPTFANLFGFLERRVRFGALVSDFTRIRSGALHKASSGVLVLRALDVLSDPLAWDRLKRVLRARAVGHEDPIGPLGLYATTLRPRPCPIDTKIVLVGPHDLYAQLLDADPDFASLFRVKVEIPSDIDRTPEGITALDAHLVRIANRRGWGPARPQRARQGARFCLPPGRGRSQARPLRPADRGGPRVRDRDRRGAPARSAHGRQRSAAPDARPWSRARRACSPPPVLDSTRTPTVVTAHDVESAWQERRERTAGAERHLREMVVANEVLLETSGLRVGVINGLSVLSAGDVQFGHPMRITAVVSLGNEGVIDVEREASLGGSLHTKGVAILRGFMSWMFGQERPVALRAQIAFEQSYGEVEGDSASSTELYAILSAIAELPVHQSIAVTGSVNQLGEVQAIGGVNAKIEGFFDLCVARGLSGQQGVIIPKSCIAQLVLRDDVAAAIAAGRFQLFAVEKITQGIEILTTVPAGNRDENGRFPAGSVFGRVERRLIEIAERMRRADGAGEMMSGGEEPQDGENG